MAKVNKTKEVGLKHVTIYVAYILVIWGFYRFLFKLPDNVEETVVEPVLWLAPLFYILSREKRTLSSIGVTLKNLFPAVYLALGLGAVFAFEALLINYLKYGSLSLNANLGAENLWLGLGVTFATAFSEEIFFRGYVFTRVWEAVKSEWLANIIVTVIWTIIHIPITIFILKLGMVDSLVYLSITAIFGLGSAFIFARTKNVFSSVLLHVLWEWPIILFR